MRNMKQRDFSSSATVCLSLSLSLGAFLLTGSTARAGESSNRTYPHCATPPSGGDVVIIVPIDGHNQPTYPKPDDHGQPTYPDDNEHEQPSYPDSGHGQPSYPDDDPSIEMHDDEEDPYATGGSGHSSGGYRASSYPDPVVTLDPIWGAPAGLEDGKTFMLVAKHSKKCLDVADHSMNVGGRLHQWSCHGEDNQRFKAKRLKKGGWVLEGVESYLCLKAGNSGLCDGDPVVQTKACKGQAPKLDVKPSKKSPYAFNLSFQYSKKCLDVAGSSQADGAKVQQWACHGGENQDWYLLPTD